MMRIARLSLTLVATLCGVALIASSGCGESSQPAIGQPQRSVYSSRDFDSGRRGGRRDAKSSLFDQSGSWMWIWMMSQDYAKGYDQGWTEGRAEANLNSRMGESRRDVTSDR
jgi:hypothetical protein